MSQEFTHRPVLLDECIEALNIRPDGIYVDGTLGRAGHSREIAKRLTTGRLICVDRDDAALEAARDRLADWMDKVTLVHSNFDHIDTILNDLGLSGVDGMLFDLGVSSPQLDDGSRGFSYMADAPLDMRMDRSEGLTAADVVNTWSQEELRRILFQYGEERCASQIAAAIVRRRGDKPIETTLELVEVIKSAMPAKALREKQHPAKRSFQAIRIAVNDELASVDRMIRGAVPRLNKGGRLAVITFHSLEDRIVKTGMAEFAKGCTCPPDFPVCVCGKTPDVKLVNKKPILPTEREVEENPRARSAKLRVAETLKDPVKAGPVGERNPERNGVSAMAARRRNTTAYHTYGSVAYAPAYDGSAVRVPRREEELQRVPQPRTRERARQKELTRTQVQVREAGQVAPFAVVGFVAVAVFAALLLLSYVQYTVLSSEMVSLRSEMSSLQKENATLSAQYEKVFDMDTIQAAVGDTMVRPTNDQVVYIDLSEPDTVVVYGQGNGENSLVSAVKELGAALGEFIEYFR